MLNVNTKALPQTKAGGPCFHAASIQADAIVTMRPYFILRYCVDYL